MLAYVVGTAGAASAIVTNLLKVLVEPSHGDVHDGEDRREEERVVVRPLTQGVGSHAARSMVTRPAAQQPLHGPRHVTSSTLENLTKTIHECQMACWQELVRKSTPSCTLSHPAKAFEFFLTPTHPFFNLPLQPAHPLFNSRPRSHHCLPRPPQGGRSCPRIVPSAVSRTVCPTANATSTRLLQLPKQKRR